MRTRIRTVLVCALAAVLLWFCFRNANLADVGREIRGARMEFLVAGLLCTALVYLLRAVRWQYLLQPVGPARFRTAFRATVIGFAATFLLPARPGEFLRPYLLARQEGLSATASFATIVVERVLDLAAVVVLLGAFLVLFDPGMARVDVGVFEAVKLGGVMAGVAAGVGLATMFGLSGQPDRLARVTMRIERVAPPWLAATASRAVRGFAEGLAVMRRPGPLLIAVAWSFVLWLLMGGCVWLVTRAFSIAMPIPGAFLILALLVVGVAVPTPGAVGGFHAAYQIGAMRFYDAGTEAAVGAAIVLHAISFVPVTLVGIVFMAQDGLSLAGVRALARLDGQAEAAPTRLEAPAEGAVGSERPFAALGKPGREEGRVG